MDGANVCRQKGGASSALSCGSSSSSSSSSRSAFSREAGAAKQRSTTTRRGASWGASSLGPTSRERNDSQHLGPPLTRGAKRSDSRGRSGSPRSRFKAAAPPPAHSAQACAAAVEKDRLPPDPPRSSGRTTSVLAPLQRGQGVVSEIARFTFGSGLEGFDGQGNRAFADDLDPLQVDHNPITEWP